MTTDNVCFVDTETTGLDPERHEIWEVGLITPDGTEHHWFLPVDLGRADPVALRIGRFHQRYPIPRPSLMVRDGVEHPARFAHDFADLTRGLHLAGAVVSFDAERLYKLLRANGACPEWHYHLIDVEALAIGWLQGRSEAALEIRGNDHPDEQDLAANAVLARPPWDSKQLTAALGIDLAQFTAHEALEDARWAKAIYKAVMGK